MVLMRVDMGKLGMRMVVLARAIEAMLDCRLVRALLVACLGQILGARARCADMRAGDGAGRWTIAVRAGLWMSRLNHRPPCFKHTAGFAEIFV